MIFAPQGLIIASTFAFVEIARKFQDIVRDRFTRDQFAAFIEQPPNWFFIASVDTALLPYLVQLPSNVRLPNGTLAPLELADSIHLATAMSRDAYLIATIDKPMKQVDLLRGKFV